MALKLAVLALVPGPIILILGWLDGWPFYSMLFLTLFVLLLWWRYGGVRDLLQDMLNTLLNQSV